MNGYSEVFGHADDSKQELIVSGGSTVFGGFKFTFWEARICLEGFNPSYISLQAPSNLMQVLYLVGEVVELFHKKRFLPQRHKGQISLRLIGLVRQTNETRTAKR